MRAMRFDTATSRTDCMPMIFVPRGQARASTSMTRKSHDGLGDRRAGNLVPRRGVDVNFGWWKRREIKVCSDARV